MSVDGRRLVQIHFFDAHREAPALGHGVARVDDEVHHHLLELARIGHDDDRRRAARDIELDFRPDQPAQHRVHSADDVAEREQAGARGLAPAESQQLPRHARAALDRLLDLAGFAARRIVGPELHQQQVGRAHDAHQNVVEVVRDAAGEPADRLELLRLPQLLFERAPLGDVADEAGDDRAAVAAHPRDRQFDRELGAVGANRRQFEAARRQRSAARLHVLRERVELMSTDRPAAASMSTLRPSTSVRRRPNICSAAGLNSRMFRLRIHRDDGVVRGFENRALPRLALASRTVHLVGQVERRRRQQQRQPVARSVSVTAITTAAAAAPSR